MCIYIYTHTSIYTYIPTYIYMCVYKHICISFIFPTEMTHNLLTFHLWLVSTWDFKWALTAFLFYFLSFCLIWVLCGAWLKAEFCFQHLPQSLFTLFVGGKIPHWAWTLIILLDYKVSKLQGSFQRPSQHLDYMQAWRHLAFARSFVCLLTGGLVDGNCVFMLCGWQDGSLRSSWTSNLSASSSLVLELPILLPPPPKLWD